jgi:hypothetical protein
MPVIWPVDVLNMRPVGRDGDTPNVKGVVPPDAVTGVNYAVLTFAIRVVEGTASVVVSVGLTVRLKVLVAVAEFWSVTVTVYVVADEVTDGVPVIAPVDALIERPVGRPGDTLYDKAPVPPDPVTGVNGADIPTSSVFVAIACVAVTAALTVRLKLAFAVAEVASVTVTV